MLNSLYSFLILLSTLNLFVFSIKVSHGKKIMHGLHRGFIAPFIIHDDIKDRATFDRAPLNEAISEYYISNCRLNDYQYRVSYIENEDSETLVVSFSFPLFLNYQYENEVTYTLGSSI
ncbi:MAG: hypothetical protein QM205_05960 [Bacillota bacterium]|jgi:hypothetical protein|nr:hypothetical protein [Bacillota bacterium]HOF65571.1 hypothetical protein [Bacilli bacterium]